MGHRRASSVVIPSKGMPLDSIAPSKHQSWGRCQLRPQLIEATRVFLWEASERFPRVYFLSQSAQGRLVTQASIGIPYDFEVPKINCSLDLRADTEHSLPSNYFQITHTTGLYLKQNARGRISPVWREGQQALRGFGMIYEARRQGAHVEVRSDCCVIIAES